MPHPPERDVATPESGPGELGESYPAGELSAGRRQQVAAPSADNIFEGGGVTVLIAAYNAAPFLHRAVRSALQQTRPPLEVLIVDDGSVDETAEVARELAANDPRVRLLSLSKNGGPARARNAGIDHARGEWIAVLDADDAFLPERLERLVEIAGEAEADVVADNFMWRDVADGSAGPAGLSRSSTIETVDKHKFVAHARPFAEEADWGLLKPLFKRSFLNANNLRYPIYSRHGEDFLLIVDILLAGGRYILSRKPGYLYTARSSGLSRTQIDYDTMAAHTIALADDERVRSDWRLRDLLIQRHDAVKRLSAETSAVLYLRDRKYAQVVLRMLSNHYFLRTVLSMLRTKARRWVNRLETAFR